MEADQPKRGRGRPRLAVPREKTSVALTADARALLARLQDRTGMGQSEVIEAALRALAERQGVSADHLDQVTGA